jgi:hypothetical protein
MTAGLQRQADDGVLVDADEPTGLADADPLLEMSQDRQRLVFGEAAVKQSAPLAFREALLAGAAGEQAALFAGAIAEGDAEVAVAASAVVATGGVRTAEVLEVIQRTATPKTKNKPLTSHSGQ